MLKYKLIIVLWCFICKVFSQDDNLSVDSDRNIQNFVIEISENQTDYDKDLIDLIKINMKYASKALFTATNNLDNKIPGIKFGKIYISLPNGWKTNLNGMVKELKSKAHFKINRQKRKKSINKPFTKQIKKCGSQGEYSVFSDMFFKLNSTDQINLIKNGKRIMREFVKLRYGVFSEKPYKNILFVHDDKKFVKGICNENIEWEVNDSPEKCSDKNSDCKYTIKSNQNHTYSVMFDTDTLSSEFFCNDKDRPHNSQAYNMHNIICKGKSVSSVILKHKDFRKKGEKQEYVDPTFEIVLQTGRQFVFVLDVSGSMNAVAMKMKMIVEEFIKTVESSAEIGIVKFNQRATIISKLVKINETEQQTILINKIKNISCYGFSNIPIGLKTGMQVLTGYPPKKFYERKSIILITDEERFDDNREDLYKNIMLTLSKSGIILHVISFNKKSDSIFNKLAKKTEGSYQGYKNNVTFEKLFKKMIERYKTKDKDIMLYIKTKKYSFTYNVEHFNNYSIFNVTVKKNLKKYNVTLTYSNIILNPTFVDNKKSSSNLIFKTLSKADPGKYFLIFEKNSRSSKTKSKKQKENMNSIKLIHVSIFGKQNELYKRSVNPIGEISKTYIDMLVANSSIKVTIDLSNCGITKDETVKVKLEIQSQNKKSVFKQMKDDGFGEDFIAGDKIFTKNIYSKDLPEKGYYSFNGYVEIIDNVTGEKIERNVMFESLYVKDVDESATTDKIPPAQMVQPTTSIINSTTIELKTIATGDDGMEGSINKYQILIRSSAEYFFNKTISAKPYDEITFLIEWEKKTSNSFTEISIRGVDKNDNVGEWSVPAPVTF